MNSSSKLFVKILSESDIPSSRLLFQLVAWEHLTSDTVFGLLPTPKALMVEETKEQWEKRLRKHGKRFGKGLTVKLQELIQQGLYPTPTARDWKGPQARSYNGQLDNLPGVIRFGHGLNGPLNPLFVGEMMGFPNQWLISPFQNGEKKA